MDRAFVDKLTRLYWEEGLTIEECAQKLGVCHQTANRYLERKRSFSEAQVNRYKRKPSCLKNGGIGHSTQGYVKILRPDHPRAMKDNYVYEHILVWEEYNNKLVPKGWLIHHINGIKDDNRPENLLAMPKGKHDKIIPQMAKRIRQLEIENRQLKRALDSSQSIFYIGEN